MLKKMYPSFSSSEADEAKSSEMLIPISKVEKFRVKSVLRFNKDTTEPETSLSFFVYFFHPVPPPISQYLVCKE